MLWINILNIITYVFINNIVPTPSVSVTALRDNPTVGKSFPLECNVTVAKGIKSSVDIIWTVNGIVERNYTVDHTVWDTKSQYVDVYNIVELQLSDNNTVYYCKAVINAHTYAESNVTIDSVAFGKYIFSYVCCILHRIYVCVLYYSY